ncbi:MAG: rhomboid family intramembrane serine protease [Armatimonadota bacterium]|nr:rhomboid family intramembrane serine protease [Armatimonadota bacterium]
MDLTQRVPFVTLGIIFINCLATYLARRDMTFYETYVLSYGLIPEQFRVGRLLSSTFIHDGFAHLALNMSVLYLFGREVERAMGKVEYIMFYVGACFAASLLHVVIVLYAMMPAYYASRPMVGASGAVAGVMGVYAVRFHRRVFRLGGAEMPALLVIMIWLVLQLALGIIGLYRDQFLGIGVKQIGYWSHLGGFAFGIGVALLADMALDGEREYLTSQARRCEENGSYLEAVQYYETLLRYDPDDAAAHAQIGKLWAYLGENEDAMKYYQTAVELFLAAGEEDQALAAADEMTQLLPSARLHSETRLRLANYLEETGRPERAAAQLKLIVENEPESIEAQMALLKMGHLQLRFLGDARSAQDALNQLLQRFPHSDWCGFARELLGEITQADGKTD